VPVAVSVGKKIRAVKLVMAGNMSSKNTDIVRIFQRKRKPQKLLTDKRYLKKMKKYKTKINISGFPLKILNVDGEPITIQGKEYLSLFVYQLPIVSLGNKIIVIKDKWHIAEETSGMPVSCGQTKEAAISFATAKLNQYSKEKILEQINKHKIN